MLESDIQKEIKKCSRCALCLQNCPIYNIKKDENNTARGLICKLLGYEKNSITKKQLSKDFKICLNCTKCKESCPSKVDTNKVFSYKNANFNKTKFSQKLFLNIKLFPLKIVYFLNFFKPKIKFSNKKTNILYFKGCISKAQHKNTYLDKLFYNPDFSCCGLPYLTSGDIKNYKLAQEKNLNLIKEAKLIVFDCATCKKAFEEYETSQNMPKLAYFTDLIENENLKLKENSKYKNKTLTFHKPCHMKESEFLKLENLIKNIKGINYKRLENYDSCCGFGGSYFMFHPFISTKIALKKAKTIKNSKADLILTMCPSCTLGLRFNQIISLNFKKTMEIRDFINNEISL